MKISYTRSKCQFCSFNYHPKSAILFIQFMLHNSDQILNALEWIHMILNKYNITIQFAWNISAKQFSVTFENFTYNTYNTQTYSSVSDAQTITVQCLTLKHNYSSVCDKYNDRINNMVGHYYLWLLLVPCHVRCDICKFSTSFMPVRQSWFSWVHAEKRKSHSNFKI